MDYPFNALGLSHKAMSEHIKENDVVIDATCGRGRDTLFLSRLVGKNGKVLAFDIQKEAVESTRLYLDENDVTNTEVHLACHSTMGRFAEENSVDGIMFNFGWLPGGDHNRFSRSDTSLAAIKVGLSLLKKGGIMTLCLYCGKENGYEEKDSVLNYLKRLDQMKYSVLLCDFINRKGDPPVFCKILKEA